MPMPPSFLKGIIAERGMGQIGVRAAFPAKLAVAQNTHG